MSVVLSARLDEQPNSEGAWVEKEFGFRLSNGMENAGETVLGDLVNGHFRSYLPPSARISCWTVEQSTPDIFTGATTTALLIYAYVKEQ